MEDAGCAGPGSVWAGHPLLSARLKLRPLRAEDAPVLVRLLDDWDTVRLTANIPRPYTQDDAHDFIALMNERRARGQGTALALERTQDGQLVGCVGFGLGEGGGAELGYWLGREYWGQGLITEAMRRLIRHLLGDLGFTHVWASVHPDNHASKRVLEKLGLAPAGHQVVEQPARGESVVMPLFALSRADWQARHRARPMLLVAAAALIDADGRVLMTSRPEGKMMAGLWEFPGGKVHEGETPEMALIRELAEELGIDVGTSCLAPLAFASHDYDTFHLLMPLYAIRTWKGLPEAKEGQALTWIRPSRLTSLPMPPADIPLAAILQDWT